MKRRIQKLLRIKRERIGQNQSREELYQLINNKLVDYQRDSQIIS